jgi:hypothetical protein
MIGRFGGVLSKVIIYLVPVYVTAVCDCSECWCINRLWNIEGKELLKAEETSTVPWRYGYSIVNVWLCVYAEHIVWFCM